MNVARTTHYMISFFDSTKPSAWFTGLMVAAPIIVFPISKIYTAFFIIILVLSSIYWRNSFRSERHKSLYLGIAAIAIPVFLTTLVLPFLGIDWEFILLKKLAEVLLGGAFGLATISLIKAHPGGLKITRIAIYITILFWSFDGFIQLSFGQDLFGVPLHNGRVGIFASRPLDFAWYFPFFAIFPIFDTLSFSDNSKLWAPTKIYSLLFLIFSNIIVFSGGSRNSMLVIGIVSLFWAAAFARQTPLQYRRVIIALFLGGFTLLVVLFYQFNDVFQGRINQTMRILVDPSYQQMNEVLSKRFDIWQPAIEIVQKNILFGIGPDQFRDAVLNVLKPGNYYYQNGRIMHAHQVLIEVVLGTGIIGLICFLAYYIYVARYLYLRLNVLTSSNGFGLAGALAFLLMWLPFGTHFSVYGSMQLFYSFYFLAIGFALLPDNHDRQPSALPKSDTIASLP